MHAFLEADMGDKPALQPKAAIGPAVRAIAVHILAKARSTVTDPELSSQDAVHDFRRAMKEWRALMRLLAPFVPDAERWRIEARDHARSLAHARDGQAALNAFDDLIKRGVALSNSSSPSSMTFAPLSSTICLSSAARLIGLTGTTTASARKIA